MLCPYCRLSLKPIAGIDSNVEEYLCSSCGYKHIEKKEVSFANFKKQTDPQEKTDAGVSNPGLADPLPIDKAPSQQEKRTRKAKKLNELHRLSKALLARVNDLEIQMERRIEELQDVAKQLEKAIKALDD